MSEEKRPEEEKRQAVIVGINDYKDPTITKLRGAENDAKDFYERLKEPNIGNFAVPDDHYLIGEDATCKRIRKAISDLLWQTDPCDLALFYFSGHGFVDGRGNGYIAPCDMLRDESVVYGINMRELKQIILDSVNKSSVLMILDCCYSGIPTKGDKSIPHVKTPYDSYFGDLDTERGGEGKIILASSEADQVSKEIPDCTHGNGSVPHPHGAFTFYLIEGLDGKAADQTGIITLGRLYEYVSNQLVNKGKQQPKLFAADASRMSAIKIAVVTQMYSDYIQKKIEEAEEFYRQEDPTFLILAADQIYEVLKINARNAKALDIKNKINEKLTNSQESVYGWLVDNELIVRPAIQNVFPVLEKLVDALCYDEITKLDKIKQTLLANLCRVSKGQIDNKVFIGMCKRFSEPKSRWSGGGLYA